MTEGKVKRKYVYTGPETRVDQYLVTLFSGVSRSYIQQIIRDKKVLVNAKICHKGLQLSDGDQVEIIDFVHPDERTIAPNPNIEFKILHHEPHYVVLEKPAGLPTHPNAFSDSHSLANGLISRFPQMVNVGENSLRPGIVHRLDSNTSGLMLAALTNEGFSALRSLFNRREIKKTYCALVLGHLNKSGEIRTDIAHHPKNPRKMVTVDGANTEFRSRRRNAHTLYQPVQVSREYSLVQVQTLTGRMHQVRVHLSSIGFPLVGDVLYQTQKQRNMDHLKLERHFLHATSLTFTDPWTGTERLFCSQLSEDLKKVINTIGFKTTEG